ncbi:MAG: 5-(carboxyamino)imidazole ribonucleotide synthase [Rhizobiales bacterium]|nr:5-(carboxyamino)imidazole ribonucleotide synthase [Hyphomicrobiales bacterium]
MRAKALPPGSVIGIMGGGQLARMLALSAGQLGLKCHIFVPEEDSPAFHVSAAHTVAGYRDEAALARFAEAVDVVTYEFENVPVEAVRFLESRVPVRPGAKALEVAQDRLNEKSLARELGAATAEYAAVNSLAELEAAAAKIGLPAILKTTRLGYDGKGQAKIMSVADLPSAWAAMKGSASILESFVTFEREVSVIAARGIDGQVAAFEVTENVHRNHILHTSTVPANVSRELAAEAVFIAQRFLERLDYVGVMGVEFFVGKDVIYVNEIAPRVHNSGHWTQNGCMVSQFEQHIRAVAGWPLGATQRHSDVVMTNLLGDDIHQWRELAAEPGLALHHYGKTEARPGRKMGHVNRLAPRS